LDSIEKEQYGEVNMLIEATLNCVYIVHHFTSRFVSDSTFRGFTAKTYPLTAKY